MSQNKNNFESSGRNLIDFHSHILPALDHGSAGVNTSVNQLKLIKSAGVGTVCATSHFYPQKVLLDDFLAKRDESLAELLLAVGDDTTARPRIILGAEVLICEGIENMDGLSRLCLEGTSIMLLEMPLTGVWSNNLYETVYAIREMGITPILAHVDRYPKKNIEPLLSMGIKAQINAESIMGFLHTRHLKNWVDEGHIVAFGSDLHGCAEESYSSFERLVSKHRQMADTVMERTQRLVESAVLH